MDAKTPVSVIGMLGTTLDRGFAQRRWDRWRPTVALGLQPDFQVSRLDLLYPPEALDLARLISGDLQKVSPQTRVDLHPLPLADPWDFEGVYDQLGEWANAHPPTEEGMVHITTGTHVVQICLFLLAEACLLPRVLLQTHPGTTPAGRTTRIDLDLSRYDRIAARFAAQQKAGQRLLTGGLETRNPEFSRMIEEMEQVAVSSEAPILLTGPTGAGKTWLARRIYDLRRSRGLKGPFVEVNCATLRGDGAMSALFGHVRGAFTGAAGERAGLLKSANGGMLFLDEIGELGIEEQAMLLRAVEERRFLPVGADKEVRSDFQLIAGTNRDLRVEAQKGTFREDLLARIDVWTFPLPGLRRRMEDLEPLLDQELRLRGQSLGRRLSFSREGRANYLDFCTGPEARWTGNLRDLAASVQRLGTLAPGGRIDEATVSGELKRLRGRWSQEAFDPLSGLLSQEQREELDRFERVQLEEVVRVCRDSRSLSEAGRELFAVSRQKKSTTNDADRLRKYLARFGLEFERVSAR